MVEGCPIALKMRGGIVQGEMSYTPFRFARHPPAEVLPYTDLHDFAGIKRL